MKTINLSCEENMKIKYGMLILILLNLLVFSGCQKDQSVNETAAPVGSESYPEPVISVPLINPSDYPAPDDGEGNTNSVITVPQNAPVRENASLMQVEILSLTQSKVSPDYVIVHVLVNATTPVKGFDEYDSTLAGQEIDILLVTGDAISLAPGDVINLNVSYRGDEWGGGYYGSNISYEK
jgi:hypothetical protein